MKITIDDILINIRLADLGIGDDEEKVIKTYGSPDYIQENEDSVKWFFYESYDLRIDIENSSVLGWKIHFFDDTELFFSKKYNKLSINSITKNTNLEDILLIIQALNQPFEINLKSDGYAIFIINKNATLVYKLMRKQIYDIGSYSDKYINFLKL